MSPAWELSPDDVDRELAQQRRHRAEVIQPAFDSYANSQHLVGEWRAGRCTHSSESQRIEFLGRARDADP